MKNNIISCPTPKQVESDDILNIQEKAQAYFDEEIVPILKNAVHSPQQIGGHLRYAAYVEAALKSKGWQLRWDTNLRSDVIEVKPKFKLKRLKVRVTRPGLFTITAVNMVVFIRLITLMPHYDWWTPLYFFGGAGALFASLIYSIVED